MRAPSVLMLLSAAFSVGFAASPTSGGAARTAAPHQVQQESSSINPLLTDDRVSFWIAKWQARLSLEDWKIESKIVRARDLPENAVANIHWSLPNKKATIRVLDAQDSTVRKSEILKDTELSVVHELVHLSMSKLPLDPKHTELEEEAVKKLSVALLELADSKK